MREDDEQTGSQPGKGRRAEFEQARLTAQERRMEMQTAAQDRRAEAQANLANRRSAVEAAARALGSNATAGQIIALAQELLTWIEEA